MPFIDWKPNEGDTIRVLTSNFHDGKFFGQDGDDVYIINYGTAKLDLDREFQVNERLLWRFDGHVDGQDRFLVRHLGG